MAVIFCEDVGLLIHSFLSSPKRNVDVFLWGSIFLLVGLDVGFDEVEGRSSPSNGSLIPNSHLRQGPTHKTSHTLEVEVSNLLI